MTAPWPCSTCGAPGVRNVFANGYCSAHLGDLYKRFNSSVWRLDGIGLQAGPRRPDIGPEYVELACVACDATWVGALLERCPWCVDAHRLLIEASGQRVLEPPDVDPADREYESRMRAWAQRLARAIDAELITRDRALAAWRREVSDVAA